MTVKTPGSDAPADFESLATQLKTVLLNRDRRIESLELENRRLRERLDLIVKLQTTPHQTHAEAGDARVQSPDPITSPANPPPLAPIVKHATSPMAAPQEKSFIDSDFVRLMGPPRGLHSDGWAEPRVRVSGISARPLKEAKLEVWFRPVTGGGTADFTVKVNGQERRRVEVKIGAVSVVAVPLDVTANSIFELDVVCDYRSPTEPPEARTLSYVMRSVRFE